MLLIASVIASVRKRQPSPAHMHRKMHTHRDASSFAQGLAGACEMSIDSVCNKICKPQMCSPWAWGRGGGVMVEGGVA